MNRCMNMLIGTLRGLEMIKVLKYLLLFCFQPSRKLAHSLSLKICLQKDSKMERTFNSIRENISNVNISGSSMFLTEIRHSLFGIISFIWDVFAN